ncbi:MAG: type II secretion system secretin GspD [Deltaproteobacteria bacterium]|nr:type II secretion system secretin GspD [Deltaproteobacteria bacterium]
MAAQKVVSFGSSFGQKPDKITINFVDADISSIIRILSEMTGKNFIYDESLKGKVTIIAPEKLTADEALSLFTSALELKNFTMVPSGDSFKIIPSASAKQSSTRVLRQGEKARPDEYIVRLIPLNYIPAQEAYVAISPLISRNGQISVFGARNSVLVVDTAQNVEKVLSILASVDSVRGKGDPEIIYLKNAQAETVAEKLKQEEQRRSGRNPNAGGASDASITYDPRLNAVILSDALPDKDFYKRFIALLDVSTPEASNRINVYYLENAEAENLSKVIETLTMPPPGQPQGARGMTQEFTGRIVITPDKSTNALIIMASPSDYNNLVQVIRKLDRRPKQVFVEAMITEVTVDKAIELGTKFRLTAKENGAPVAIGGVGTVDVSAMQTILSGLAGLSIGGLGNFITVPVTRADGTTFNMTAPGFAALFSLSDFKDVVNVLSTPHILTSDNSDAEIMVGENVPFLSQLERASTTTTQPLLQSIERKDVGIRLKIKPKISEGDFVKLDIYQEISAVSPTTTVGASDLITTKRSANTTVVVKNRQTVVIGGLIQNRKVNDTTKVPILGDIPLLGWLFKSSTDQNQKTNLLVFITPYIIEDFHGLEDIRNRKEREFDEQSGPGGENGKPRE